MFVFCFRFAFNVEHALGGWCPDIEPPRGWTSGEGRVWWQRAPRPWDLGSAAARGSNTGGEVGWRGWGPRTTFPISIPNHLGYCGTVEMHSAVASHQPGGGPLPLCLLIALFKKLTFNVFIDIVWFISAFYFLFFPLCFMMCFVPLYFLSFLDGAFLLCPHMTEDVRDLFYKSGNPIQEGSVFMT